MKKITLLIVSLFISSITFSQNNYYVAKNGNNSNTGSLNSPWKTIQYGVNQLSAGDILHIKAGTYEEKLDIDVSGSSSAYITIRNYQNDNVILDAINSGNDSSIIWTDNAYLRIQGLHITNNIGNFREGITLQGAAHHIEILNNKISNIKFSADPNATITNNTNAVPLNVYADSATDSIHTILIKGNEVFNNQTGYSENIAAGGNFSTFIIEDNIVHDNTNIGIDIGGNYKTVSIPHLDQGRYGVIRNNLVYNCNAPYSTAAGIYIDGGRDIIVENNICHHNGYGGEIGCEENGSTSNVTFRNNIFYNNFYTGMHIGGYDPGTTGVVLNSNVYNNTFYQNDVGNNFSGEIALTKLENCRIENNIFYISNQNLFINTSRTQTNLILDYNLVYANAGSNATEADVNGSTSSLADYYNSTGYGVHSKFENPMFAHANSNNYHINTNSPAIDAGNPNYTIATGNMNISGITITNVDIDNEPRVKNIVDCGADESSVTLGNEAYTIQNIVIYPNPTHDKIYLPESLLQSSYQIFTSQGKLISKGVLTTNSIDFGAYYSGLYFVQLKNYNTTFHHLFKVLKVD